MGVGDRVQKDFIMNGDCLIWKGAIGNHGYGSISVNGKDYLAHRLAYRLFHSVDIPVGMTIDHLCRNRICINPLHLELVTLKENILRSNGVSAIYARRTSCKRGHLFTVGNIGKRRSGRRCLACHREDARNRRIK